MVTQGLELYGILKAKGVEARLVYYPDEGHWILKPQNSLHWYGEVLGWLERYLSDSGSAAHRSTRPRRHRDADSACCLLSCWRLGGWRWAVALLQKHAAQRW